MIVHFKMTNQLILKCATAGADSGLTAQHFTASTTPKTSLRAIP